MSKHAKAFKGTGGTVSNYMAMVQDQTTSGHSKRNVLNTSIAQVDTLMKNAMDSCISDLVNPTTGNPTELANWQEECTNNPSVTHMLDLFPTNFAARIINNPAAGDCIAIDYIDPRIITSQAWPDRNGQTTKAIWIRYDASISGNMMYHIPTNKYGSLYKAWWQHGSAVNKRALYDEGTCSNNSYITSTACVGAGETWTSTHGVTLTEVTDLEAAYATNIGAI